MSLESDLQFKFSTSVMESLVDKLQSNELMESKKKGFQQMKKKKIIMKSKDLSWIDSTVFNCTICDEDITGRKGVKIHFQIIHKETDPFPGGIRKSLHESVKVIGGEYYSCKIEGCERKAIKTFYDDINQHLLRVHKMTMVQYHDSYEKNKPQTHFVGSNKVRKKDIKVKESEHKNKKKGGVISVSKKKGSLSRKYKTKRNTQNKTKYGKLIDWIDSSVFKCRLCESKLSSRREVRKHFAMLHRQTKLFSMSNGERIFNFTIIEGEYYECKVEGCSSSIKRKYNNINMHMRRNHKLGLSEYYDIYESKSMEKVSDKANDDVKDKDEILTKNDKETVEKTAIINQQPIDRSQKTKFPWIYKDMVYRCRDCETDLSTIEVVTFHFKTLHNQKFRHGVRPSHSLENVSSYICKVVDCKVGIKPFYDSIRLHVMRRHKMTLKEYHKKHETNGIRVERDIHESKSMEKISVQAIHDVKDMDKILTNKEDHTHKKHETYRIKMEADCSWMTRGNVYKCKDCVTDLKGPKKVKEHFKKYHQDIKPFPKGPLNKPHNSVEVEKITKIICKVDSCNHKLRAYYNNIFRHMKNCHKISVKEYCEKYRNNKEIPLKNSTSTQNVTTALKQNPDIWSGVKWYNRCKFMCQLCNEVANGYEIRSHMASKHKLGEKKEYFAITTDKYKCKICDLTISFLQIKSHVYSKHRLVFTEYGKRYESRNLNRKEKKPNTDMMVKLKVESALEDIDSSQRKVYDLASKVKVESALEDLNSSKRKVDDLFSTPKVKRQKCILRCNICSLIGYSVPAMKNHIRSDHEGKSTSSFTDVDESEIEDCEGKKTTKENTMHTVKKETASSNLVDLVDNILKNKTESYTPEKQENCTTDSTNKMILEPSQESSSEVEQNDEAIKQAKKKTFYRCPFKTDKEGRACDFNLSKDEMKWKNSAMAMDHLQMFHFEQAQQEKRIKWIKITA